VNVTTVPDTVPYPWPFDGRLDGAVLALVLAGWDEGWRGRSIDADGAIERCGRMAAAIRSCGGLVVTVSHWFSPALPIDGRRESLPSSGVDAFHGGPLDDVLRQSRRSHLVVAGLGLEGPVHSTLRSANDRGYECLLVADASAALTDDCAASAIHSVTMSGGIFGAVGDSSSLIAALTATTPGGAP
jgi:nicotinamidase-related amidase